MTIRAARVIQGLVCDHFGVDRDELLGRRRWQTLCLARHVGMYLCRERLGLSYPEIGIVFEGRDHTTIMGACARVRALLETSPETRDHVTTIEHTLDELAPRKAAAE